MELLKEEDEERFSPSSVLTLKLASLPKISKRCTPTPTRLFALIQNARNLAKRHQRRRTSASTARLLSNKRRLASSKNYWPRVWYPSDRPSPTGSKASFFRRFVGSSFLAPCSIRRLYKSVV